MGKIKLRIDFTTNYCGLYYSNGRIQSSVAYGDKDPVSDLDRSCRDHDTRYALAKSNKELDSADLLFYKEQFGKGLRPSLYSLLVLHVNRLTRGLTTGKSFFALGSDPNQSAVEGFSENTRYVREKEPVYERPGQSFRSGVNTPDIAPELLPTVLVAEDKLNNTTSSDVVYAPTTKGAAIQSETPVSTVSTTSETPKTTTVTQAEVSKEGTTTEKTKEVPLPEVSRVIDELVSHTELVSSNNPAFRKYLSKHYRRLYAIKNRKRVYISN